MSFFIRGGAAATAVVAAALVAAGCGGSGGSGATAAAQDSPAIDRIPADAMGYVTIDTDLSGDNWKQFDRLARSIDSDFPGVEEQFSRQTASGDGDDVQYDEDIKPWLGESAGAALTSIDEAGAPQAFAWAELKDRTKFERFAKARGLEAGEKIDGFATYTNPDDDTVHVGYDDEVVFTTDSREQLEAVIGFDGDSIADAEGVDSSLGEVEGDALATLVVAGDGLRRAAKRSPGGGGLALDASQLDDFRGMAVALSAEDTGMRLDGYVESERKQEATNSKHSVFEQLPANTLLAVGGSDLGRGLKDAADEAGRSNPEVQRGIGQATGVLGVDLDDLEEGLDGDFAFGVSSDEEGLGSIAAAAASTTMGGGLAGLDPKELAEAVSVILAFEETGSTNDVLEKLVGSGAGLAGGAEAQEASSGDFDTRTTSVAGLPLTSASSDDVAAVTLGADVFDAWGDDTLGDHETFRDAWKAADAPAETAGVLWFDAARVAGLAGTPTEGDGELGGLVGWVEADGSNARLGMFLHVDEK